MEKLQITMIHTVFQKKMIYLAVILLISPLFSQLVSYVSIIYGEYQNIKDLLPIDILLALATVKSIIIKDTNNTHYPIRLPIWSPFYNRKEGVFVGSSLGSKTNCSFGRYENHTSTAHKIVSASQDCPKDAQHRWRIPYTTDNLNKLSYKVELLDPKEMWKTYKGYEAIKKFKNDGAHGILLKLPNGKSATYLPVVFREHPNWSISKAMRQLTEKAEGRRLMKNERDEWKKGEIKIYKSKSYTWDPYMRIINIFPSYKKRKYTRKKR